jgi:uncharacterized metal-binding protein YceD (DUF177 family)
MIIDLIAMESSPYHFAASIAPAEIDLESEGAALKSDARIEAVVTRHIAQADVEGEIIADVELECSRCLQPVEKLCNFRFALRSSRRKIIRKRKKPNCAPRFGDCDS